MAKRTFLAMLLLGLLAATCTMAAATSAMG